MTSTWTDHEGVTRRGELLDRLSKADSPQGPMHAMLYRDALRQGGLYLELSVAGKCVDYPMTEAEGRSRMAQLRTQGFTESK